MIKFIEIQNKNEINGAILDYLVKVVATENGEEINKAKDNLVALLVNLKYDTAKKQILVNNESLIYSNEEKGWTFGYVLSEILKSEIENYFKNEMEAKPREKTTDEIREEFVSHLWHMIDYWEKETRKESSVEKMQGLAFSILTALDGCAGGLPGFIVAPSPHEEDKEYHIQNGENYYPYNSPDSVKGDIGGILHDSFYPIGRKLGYI